MANPKIQLSKVNGLLKLYMVHSFRTLQPLRLFLLYKHSVITSLRCRFSTKSVIISRDKGRGEGLSA